MAQGCTIRPGPLVAISADIVSAYISNNPLPAADLPNFIGQIYASLKVISVATPAVRSGELKPAVPVKNSSHPNSSSASKTANASNR
jgi:predicted transcriptional regulator